mgnify:CR=1 FL=1
MLEASRRALRNAYGRGDPLVDTRAGCSNTFCSFGIHETAIGFRGAGFDFDGIGFYIGLRRVFF